MAESCPGWLFAPLRKFVWIWNAEKLGDRLRVRRKTIPNQGPRVLIVQRIWRGLFSAVSKPIFATNTQLNNRNVFQDLPVFDLRTFTVFHAQQLQITDFVVFRSISQKLANFRSSRLLFAEVLIRFYRNPVKFQMIAGGQ